MVKFMFKILLPLFIITLQGITRADNSLLNEETEKLICLIHLFNKRVSATEHHSSHFKEEFQKCHSPLQSILADFTHIKTTLTQSSGQLSPATIKELALSFKFLSRLNSFAISPLVHTSASIIHALTESLDRLLALESFAATSSHYKRLSIEPTALPHFKKMREHLTFLHLYLKNSSLQRMPLLSTLSEEKFLSTLVSSPAKFNQLIDRCTITHCALHNIVISQMEHVYNLQHIIALFEKEPSSIVDDIHDKNITFTNKLSSTQQHFAHTIKAFISLAHNSVNVVNNGLAVLQAANSVLNITLLHEQEIENEIIHIIECLAQLESKGPQSFACKKLKKEKVEVYALQDAEHQRELHTSCKL